MPDAYHFDYETYSACDIQVCGAYRYAQDPTTEILMIGLAKNDEEPVVWLPPSIADFAPWVDDREQARAEELLREMTRSPKALVYAHNAQFEIAITDYVFERTLGFRGPQHHQWRCTAAMARRAALPAKLAKVGIALDLPQKKDSAGLNLIKTFSVPQKPNARSKKEFKPRIYWHDEPEKFQKFVDYCRQDVRTEREVHKELAFFELDGLPLQTFQVDIEMNGRGFPVNLDALHKAQAMIDEVQDEIGEMFFGLTGLTYTQNAKLRVWLAEHGYQQPDLTADSVEKAATSGELDSEGQIAIDLFRKLNYAATKKIKTMIRMAGPNDNKVRGTLTWHGAGPGRWSGSGVQPQNFKRPDPALIAKMPWKDMGFSDSDEALDWFTQSAYRDLCAGMDRDTLEVTYGGTLEVLSSCIRHFMHDIDETGERPMMSSDYSAIEARKLAWLAGEEWRLEVFRTHGKIYEASASKMFKIPMDQITKPLRQKGKIAELALGYMGSENALITMGALDMGIPANELHDIVKMWREANPAIVAYWKLAESAAIKAVERDTEVPCRLTSYFTKTVGRMKFLFCRLPSGRLIAYPKPKIQQQMMFKTVSEGGKVKWKRVVSPTPEQIAKAKEKYGPKNVFVKPALTVYGQITDAVLGHFAVSPGTLVENQCQGSAADTMGIGCVNLERAGYRVNNLIHDEALCYYEGEHGGQSAEQMDQLMCDQPAWSKGLPLKAEGAIVPFYKK
mgnify:CR=1 FL=1